MPNDVSSALGANRPGARTSSTPPTSLGTLAVAVVIVAGLYFGREVFVPMALAILLSFALGPAVLLLRRGHLGRVPAVIAVVIVAFAIIGGVGAFVGTQLAHLAGELPGYQSNIGQKIHSLRHTTSPAGIVDRASAMVNNLRKEIAKPAEGVSKPKANMPQQQSPVPVEVRPSASTPFQIIYVIATPLLQQLATAGIVVVFVVFFLLQREDLRDRFIRLAGAGDLRRTTVALDDAAKRLSRYLLMQTAVNGSFGVLVGSGLWLVGVPNPGLWGILGMLLRFIPYIGPIIAAALPMMVAFAVDPGWSMLLWTTGLFVVVELTTGQAIEPWLYGHSTGLSGLAVVVAAAFWTLLWGPIGLLLSTPLTMCLVVLGRHVDHLQFLEVLLGDQPALAPEETFYQRILADDPDEASHLAEMFLKENSLSTYYDQIAIRGLALAQLDVNRGVLLHDDRVRIKEAVDAVIDNLSDHDDAPAEDGGASTSVLLAETLAPSWQATPVLCVAGRGSLDEASAAMLAQLVQKQGIGARVVPSTAVSPRNLFALDATGVQMVYLCYLEPGAFTNPHYLIRRLRRKLPKATIVGGFWTLKLDEADERSALTKTGADLIITLLHEAVAQITAAAREAGVPRLATERHPSELDPVAAAAS